MKALIVYSLLVAVGAVIAALLGLWVERNFGSAISLVVFLSLFFANFAGSWVLTILIMDGTLRSTKTPAPTSAKP
jgi:fluoride ion exporter CrcB/FEX